MKLSQGLLVVGVILTGALLFGAYSAASAPLPEGFPAPPAMFRDQPEQDEE